MIRKIAVSLFILLILVALGAVIKNKLLNKKKPKPRVTVVQAPLVKSVIVQNKKSIPKISTEGFVYYSNEVSVAVEGKGTLNSSLSLKTGSTFKKGQVIAFVTDAQLNSNFQASLASFNRLVTDLLIDIQVEYPSEKENWQAFSSTVAKGTLPNLPPITNNKLQNLVTAKGVTDAYYSLQSQQANLSKRKFIAPFSGFINKVNTEKGSFINGTTVVCTIVKNKALEISFSLNPETDVNIGDKIRLLKSNTPLGTATVVRKDQNLSAVTQQKTFYATINRTNIDVLSNDYLTVEIPTSKKASLNFLLPSFAVGKSNVHLITKDSTITNYSVTIIGTKNDSLMVSSLSDNDRVVLESFADFKNGQKVRF